MQSLKTEFLCHLADRKFGLPGDAERFLLLFGFKDMEEVNGYFTLHNMSIGNIEYQTWRDVEYKVWFAICWMIRVKLCMGLRV